MKKIAGVIPGGQKLESVISGIITTNLIPKPILTIAKLAPEVAELVKVGKAINYSAFQITKLKSNTRQVKKCLILIF